MNEGYKGTNDLDKACLKHDSAYDEYRDTENRNIADNELSQEANRLAYDLNQPSYVRKDAKKVAALMSTKSLLGMGNNSWLSKIYLDPKQGFSGINDMDRKSGMKQNEVKGFLDTINTYTLRKPIRKKFETRRVYFKGIDYQF